MFPLLTHIIHIRDDVITKYIFEKSDSQSAQPSPLSSLGFNVKISRINRLTPNVSTIRKTYELLLILKTKNYNSPLIIFAFLIFALCKNCWANSNRYFHPNSLLEACLVNIPFFHCTGKTHVSFS